MAGPGLTSSSRHAGGFLRPDVLAHDPLGGHLRAALAERRRVHPAVPEVHQLGVVVVQVVPVEEGGGRVGRELQGVHREGPEHVRLAGVRDAAIAHPGQDAARDDAVIELQRVPALDGHGVELGLGDHVLQGPLELGDLQQDLGRTRRRCPRTTGCSSTCLRTAGSSSLIREIAPRISERSLGTTVTPICCSIFSSQRQVQNASGRGADLPDPHPADALEHAADAGEVVHVGAERVLRRQADRLLGDGVADAGLPQGLGDGEQPAERVAPRRARVAAAASSWQP